MFNDIGPEKTSHTLQSRPQEPERTNDRLPKELEEALRESPERFVKAFHASPDAITISRMSDGLILEVNAGWQKLFGYEPSEVLGRTSAAINHIIDLSHIREDAIRRLERDGFLHDLEFKLRHKSGEIRWGSTSIEKIEVNGIDCLLSVTHDITARKRLEEALRESEYRFRTMADGTPVMIWVTDLSGKMEFINKAYAEFFDVTLEQVQSGSWQMLIHPEDQAGYVNLYMECSSEQRAFQAECRVLRKDGQWRWIVSHGQPRLSEDGEFLGMAGSSLDVTERKQAEQNVSENQLQIQLQQRVIEQREQERLLIAQDIHDGPIQTLAVTILELQMVKDELQGPTDHDRLDRLNLSIQHAIHELRNIIAALRPPQLQRFGLSQAIRMYTDDFDKRYPQVKLTHDLAEDLGKLSEDVCLSLFRIYQEALSNVIRHSEATKAHVHLSFVDGMAVLQIEDNGKGMQVTPNLMDQAAEGHYGLTGIKERAKALNGEFQLFSTLGKGTIVIVKFPIT